MRRERLNQRSHGRGFSLMEVLIALVVIAFALYGILDLMASNERLSLRAARREVAIELARAKMAELQTAGFDAVARQWANSPAATSNTLTYPAERAPFTPLYNAKPFQWQVRFDRGEPQSEVMQVKVEVFWLPGQDSVSVGGLLVKR